jgi:hypothetical protein
MIRLPVRYVSLLALAAAVLLAPAAPANAADPVVDLDCTITVTTAVNPGLTPEPQHIALTSQGLTGTATCTGTIDGQAVTGTGSFAVDSQLDVTGCVNATGAGSFVLQIPTAGGTQTVAGRFTSISTAASGTVVAGDLTGTATVVAADGDCVNTPITSATSVFVVHVS